MRFGQEKVRDLAAKILDMFEANPSIHPQGAADAVRVAIGSAILDNLQEEDDIDREADELLARHEREIAQGDMDTHTLRQKFRQQIARERGFTL